MNRKRVAKNKRVILDAKTGPCVDCGRFFPPRYMHLDHVRGIKRFNLCGRMATDAGIGKLLEEIAKCDLRCPICHTARHAGDDPLAVWAAAA